MVRIRLTRKGTRGVPFYRVIVTDGRSPRDGRFLENLGYYDPTKDPVVLKLKEDRVEHWLSEGAQPSSTVRSLFRKQGILRRLAGHGTLEPEAASEE